VVFFFCFFPFLVVAKKKPFVDLIPVLYDKGYITDEGQEQINGLTALLNEFDDHIKNMVLPMGHDQDVGAVNFKMIAFRELVTELVILVDEVIEIQTVKKTYKEVFRSLAQEGFDIFFFLLFF